MTFLNDINVGGQAYKVSPVIPMGTCATPAGSEVKECSFADSFELTAGNLISVTFTYANTYGDGSTTYPKLFINGTSYPIKLPAGEYAASGAWANGQAVTFMYDGTNLIITAPVTNVVAAGNMYSVSSDAVANMFMYQDVTISLNIDPNTFNVKTYTPPKPVGYTKLISAGVDLNNMFQALYGLYNDQDTVTMSFRNTSSDTSLASVKVQLLWAR